jgi:hypothetical protein
MGRFHRAKPEIRPANNKMKDSQKPSSELLQRFPVGLDASGGCAAKIAGIQGII